MSCNINYDKLIFSVHKMSKINKSVYYVFIGKTENRFKEIFEKLENRKTILKEEIILLKNNYPDYYLDWINIVKSKILIKFIEYKIEIDDSINEIRKKIFIYLSDFEKKIFILPENQELWLEDKNKNMEIIGYYYENLKTKNKAIYKPHIYESFNLSFDNKIFKKNISENNMLIFDLLEENKYLNKIIYLSDAKEEELFLKSKKINITDKTINLYFKKFWPYVNLNYDLNEVKNNFTLLSDYYFKENYIFDLINNNKNTDHLGSCNILTVKITTEKNVTEDETNNKYLDLYPIFDYIRENIIDENTPFLRYYENSIEHPFSIISKKAMEENKINKKLLKDWLSLREDIFYKKKNDIVVKRFLKNYNLEPRYYHISINKIGNIGINISFDNENNAKFDDVKDAIKDCKKFIENINKNRLTHKINEIKNIDLPDLNINNNRIILKNNTRITYMNIIIPLKLNKPIDYKLLSKFILKFPYFITESNDNNSEEDKLDKSIQIRYKRISGFANMNDILFEIDTLKEIYDKNIGIIIKTLEKKYQKSVDEIKGYLLEWEKKYSSSKSRKIPSEFKKGILVKINDNNILFNGITKIYQIPLLYNFFSTFLNLFIKYDDYFSKDKTFKKIFSSNVEYYEENYQIDNNIKLEIDDTYDLEMDDYLDIENNEINETNIPNENKKKIVGIARDEDIDPNIRLTCEDAIPEKDTCEDFCNDEKYFLRRLQRFDNKLFRIKNEKKKKAYEQYSRQCSKNSQPVILIEDPSKNVRIKKESYTYSLKYSSDPNTMERWYICPKVWCPYCEISILETDLDPTKIRIKKTSEGKNICKTGICPYGDHQVIIRENNEDIYPGFLSKSTHPDGLCIPCCFKNSHMIAKSTFYKKLKKCIGEDIENNIPKDGKIYILGKGIPIEKDRYGKLPVEIGRILKTNLETGDLGNKSGYLRKGIKHIKNNSFLSCISDILSCDKDNFKIDISKIKSILIEKLNEDIFKSIYNGNLPNIFYTFENLSPFENFKKYLLNNEIEITHKYLWDFLQRNNILFENGINIFIFENNNLLCPKGENINNFYDINRKSILIIKSRDFYEPIYYLEGNGKFAKKTCIFNNEFEELIKLFQIALEGCKSKYIIDWISVLKDNMKKYNKELTDNITISNGYNLNFILKEILKNIKDEKLSKKFLPKLQYVDSYNKVFALLLINGLYIPIDPSKLIESIKYKIINNMNEIEFISFNETINYTEQIKNNTNLKLTITHKILDLKSKKNIIALVNESNRFIPIKPILNKDKKLKVSILNYYSDIDEALYDKIEKTDKRIEIMNKKKFEDETYIRLKFELSKFLQIESNKKYLEEILNIVNSTKNSIALNRIKLFSILNNIYKKIVIIDKNDDYYDYKTPNKRVPCFLKEDKLSCEDDPHCSYSDSCKLFINETHLIDSHKKINNYHYYLSKITDELLRYELKRDEIINDNIPIIINKKLIEKNKKYIIINSANFHEVNNLVEQLYLDNKGVHIDTRDLYEEINTKEYAFKDDKYIKSNILLIKNVNKFEELSIYWSKLLTDKFKVKVNNINTIFQIFVLILNLNDMNMNTNLLKNKLVNYLKTLNENDIIDLYKKDGDKIFKYISSFQLLIEEILSDSYHGSLADLIFLSKIFNINIIILEKRIKKNESGYKFYKINGSDNFVILYTYFQDNKNIYNIVYNKNRLIFKKDELPDKFIKKMV